MTFCTHNPLQRISPAPSCVTGSPSYSSVPTRHGTGNVCEQGGNGALAGEWRGLSGAKETSEGGQEGGVWRGRPRDGLLRREDGDLQTFTKHPPV